MRRESLPEAKFMPEPDQVRVSGASLYAAITAAPPKLAIPGPKYRFSRSRSGAATEASAQDDVAKAEAATSPTKSASALNSDPADATPSDLPDRDLDGPLPIEPSTLSLPNSQRTRDDEPRDLKPPVFSDSRQALMARLPPGIMYSKVMAVRCALKTPILTSETIDLVLMHVARDYDGMVRTLKRMRAEDKPILRDHIALVFSVVQGIGQPDLAVEFYRILEPELGIRPDINCYASLIRAYLAADQLNMGYKLYLHLVEHKVPVTNGTARYLLTKLFGHGYHKLAWGVFNELRLARNVNEQIYLTMIQECAHQSQAERAFVLYRDFLAMGFSAQLPIFEALIHACSMRPDYYMEAFALLKELETRGFSPNVLIYTSLLRACARVKDLRTGAILWRMLESQPAHSPLRPNFYCYREMLWLLASIETPKTQWTRLRRKQDPSTTARPRSVVLYEVATADLVAKADALWKQMLELRGRPQSSVVDAYLAVMVANRARDRAEQLFRHGYKQYACERPSPKGHEMMLTLYAYERDHEAGLALFGHEDVASLKPQMSATWWIQAVRLHAMANKVEEGVALVEEAATYGHRLPAKYLNMLSGRLVLLEAWPLMAKLKALVVPSRLPGPLGRRQIWTERAARIEELLTRVYGRTAGRGSLRGVHANMKPKELLVLDTDRDASDDLVELEKREFPKLVARRERERKRRMPKQRKIHLMSRLVRAKMRRGRRHMLLSR